ncbi:MAG: carbohydrate kinase, partial [Anaerolineae bacterium]|nr:carbohydrate kinase [Anaerolineae bacterium]
MNAILILDIGSSSVRALLLDEQAQVIPGTVISRPYEFETLPPGSATMNPLMLQALVESCVDEIVQFPHAIQAAGITTFVGNVLGIDVRGLPVTPIYSYADTRSTEDVALLREKIDPEAVHQRTGCIHHTAYLPARLHWLRRTHPERFYQVEQWLDFGTYLYAQWFSTTAATYSVASWSGLLNRLSLNWDEEWLAVLGLDEKKLPALTDYTNFQSGLRPEYVLRWPALKNVPFYLPVGDGAAANVGSGAVTPSHLALTVGTTAALRLISDDQLPAVPAGLWSYRVARPLHLIGGATTEGGNIFSWVRETLNLTDIPALEAEITQRPADAHGLTFLPLLAGERSPGWSIQASGAVVGLRLSTAPVDILQAALEGVALRLALIADQLRPLTGSAVNIMV